MWPAVHKSIARANNLTDRQTVGQTELEQKQLQQKGAARNINKFIKKVSKKQKKQKVLDCSAQTNGTNATLHLNVAKKKDSLFMQVTFLPPSPASLPCMI